MSSTILTERQRASHRRRKPGSPPGEAAGVAVVDGHDVLGDMPARPVGIDRRLVAKALTIRRTEERLLDLFSQGQISGTVHTCIGQEWVGVAVAEQLRPGDFLFSNHRGHGHYLAWTDDVEGLLAELMGRATGVCGGRGGSQHLCRDGFFSNGIQGGTVPVAAGLAMAQSLDGGTGIAVVFVGDGTLGEGVVYETLNIAARWSLPLLVVIEDNGIAQSTARTETLAGDVPGRAAAFGLDYLEATTDEPVELLAAAGDAVRCVREARRPLVLHVRTRRLRPHSKGDDTRDPAALAALAAGDPLTRVLAPGSPVVRELLTAIDERLDAAVARAAAAPVAGIAFSAEARDGTEGRLVWQPIAFSPRRVVDAIRYALADGLERDDRIVLLGEDLSDPYGGAFKITAGLSSRFDGRVLNTPISEAAIVGIGSGLAMAGWRPVVEIMFGDFLMLAADQIVNHAAKFAWMYGGKVRVPLVIRTPMGGYRGYGPTHSQSLEKHLLGLPGTRVVAVTHRYCPGLMYRALLEGNDRPTLVVENKLLYGRMTDPTPPPGRRIEASAGEFPTVRIAPPGECQLTVVAYGGMVPLAESAARVLHDDEDLACELLIPTQLYPLDLTPVVESVRRTGRLLVVEEGQGFAGFAGELIAQVAIEGGPPARFARVCAGACPIPAARSAEQQALPDVERILTSAKNLALA